MDANVQKRLGLKELESKIVTAEEAHLFLMVM